VKRRRRRVLTGLAVLASVAGLLLVGDAVATLVWQEPVSALRAWHAQKQLSDRLDHQLAEGATLPIGDRRALGKLPDVKGKLAFAARRLRERTADGEPLGRIVLPSQGRRYVLVAGDSEGDLRKGPGVYPATVLPGEGGTTAVAGHRTTYLAPFRDINKLHAGDRIEMEMPYGTFVYAVSGQRIVDPGDVGVVRGNGQSRLVLTACHPLYSAAQRIVVFARLIKSQPDKQALAGLGGSRRHV
jgi:sortase A